MFDLLFSAVNMNILHVIDALQFARPRNDILSNLNEHSILSSCCKYNNLCIIIFILSTLLFNKQVKFITKNDSRIA